MHEAKKKKRRQERKHAEVQERKSSQSAAPSVVPPESKGRHGLQRLGAHGQATRERARAQRRSRRLQVGKTASARPRQLEGTRRGVARAGEARHDNGEETAAHDRACHAKDVLNCGSPPPSQTAVHAIPADRTDGCTTPPAHQRRASYAGQGVTEERRKPEKKKPTHVQPPQKRGKPENRDRTSCLAAFLVRSTVYPPAVGSSVCRAAVDGKQSKKSGWLITAPHTPSPSHQSSTQRTQVACTQAHVNTRMHQRRLQPYCG
ncbi:hypothetical protein DFH08DRAFT_884604 [Mycena albidolilacea]|uniref:Uncharacterized protein n=1 Tax=Mycena albidolilacea TaxID=1033008 RepID=A0AAD6ZKZ8_9AGAR|nr:hypothetical protein DFH08DRAFT_884604 [Mycena albidolilacea]